MADQRERAQHFLALHGGPGVLLMPNAWDLGSAKVLAALGFQALATTSSGFAATLGRQDGKVAREESLAHAAAMAAAVDVPVSADLENCFADDPDGVAETMRLAVEAGLAGASVEDYAGDEGGIYDRSLAAERVAAAVEAAHGGPVHLVVTARAENLIRGRNDLDDTTARLQAYEAAGADVLYAPGLTSADDIRRVVSAVSRPVNVLARPGVPPVAELADLGVRRLSVGGAFAWTALGALVEAGRELLEQGTFGYFERAAVASPVLPAALGSS